LAASCSRACRHTASIAEPVEAAVIDPPDTGLGGIRESPRPTRTCSTGRPSASAAIWVITVYVPVPMSCDAVCTSARTPPRPSPMSCTDADAFRRKVGYVAVAIP
jgi:hypothetical protein